MCYFLSPGLEGVLRVSLKIRTEISLERWQYQLMFCLSFLILMPCLKLMIFVYHLVSSLVIPTDIFGVFNVFDKPSERVLTMTIVF